MRSAFAALVLSLFSAGPALAKDGNALANFAVAKITQVTNRAANIVEVQTNAGTDRLEKADEKGAPDALLVRFAANSNHKVTRASVRGAHVVNAIGVRTIARLQAIGADPALIEIVEAARVEGLETVQGNAEAAHDQIADALEAALADEEEAAPEA